MVDAITSKAIEALISLANEEVKLLSSTREEVNKLSGTLTSLQACLHDAEMRQIKEKSVQVWLSKLKYVAYQVDNVLDEWKVKSQQLSATNFCSGKSVWNFFAHCTCFQHVVLRHNVGKKIKEINVKLDRIASEKNNFKFQQILEAANSSNPRITSSKIDISDVYGRQCEKDKLISMLISESSSEPSDIHVIPIVGIGGYGKTTLAQAVFNDQEVKSHFQEHAWVCVSNEFDVSKIIGKIIEVVKKETPRVVELEALTKILGEIFKSKRLLLVLDDVWNEDDTKWQSLINEIKNCVGKGSKLVVTTRLQKTEKFMSRACIQLGPLSDDDCWSLFNKVAFQSMSENSELIEIGRKIVERCKGTPLAVKTVASALRTKTTVREWMGFLKSQIWNWNQSELSILPSLLLSYTNLSNPQLKQCFQYCSLYPKDYVFKKKKMVKMWIAQGYIAHDAAYPQELFPELEDIAEGYFDELLRLSLFQEPEIDIFGNIISCKMHDLVHDVAQFVTKGEFIRIDVQEEIGKVRSMNVVHCAILTNKFEGNCFNASEFLRTLLVHIPDIVDDSLPLQQLRCLRVLELTSQVGIKVLPTSIGRLVHLRYLNLSRTSIKALPKSMMKLWNLVYLNLSSTKIEAFPEVIVGLRNLRHLNLKKTSLEVLPESIGKLENLRYLKLADTELDKIPETIGKLRNLRCLNLRWTKIKELPECITGINHLQVLSLGWCGSLCKLPDGIHKMTGLKHLKILYSDNMMTLPAGIGKLTSLQKLDRFVVSANEEGWCNLGELRDLNNLHGKLVIEKLEEAGSREEANSAMLENKRFLFELILKWSPTTMSDTSRMLMMRRRRASAEDVMECLRPHPNLKYLEIHNYPGTKFPSWVAHPIFSSLEDVYIDGCPNCTELPPLGNLPNLQTLRIRSMPSLRKVGADFFGCSSKNGFPKLKELYFVNLEKWEEWEPPLTRRAIKGDDGNDDGEEEITATMPCLREITIWSCDKLKVVPSIFSQALTSVSIKVTQSVNNENCWMASLPHSVERVLVSGPSRTVLVRLPTLPRLKHLGINSDDELTELSKFEVRFSERQELSLYDCPNLRSLPNQMSSVKELVIRNCPNLRSLPNEMSSMKELRIFDCPELKESCKMGWRAMAQDCPHPTHCN